MGSSAKIGKFFIGRSQKQKRCTFLGPKHKSATWNLVYMCTGGLKDHKSLNLIEFSQFVQDLLGFFGSRGWGWPTIIYISSGLFRGKESLNRIKNISISSRLIEFWCFGISAALGRGRWVGCLGHRGCPYTCVHTCTCMHTHVYMYRNCKRLPPWRHPCLSCLQHACAFMHVCVCVHMLVHVCMRNPQTPTPNPIPIHPLPHSRGDPQNQ